MLLAATMTWSCTVDSTGPAAVDPDPGFLTVELTAPVAHRDIGVLLELEGPGIETVWAAGHELYQSSAPGGIRSSWRAPYRRVPSCSSGCRTAASFLCTGSASSRSREKTTGSGTQGTTGPWSRTDHVGRVAPRSNHNSCRSWGSQGRAQHVEEADAAR